MGQSDIGSITQMQDSDWDALPTYQSSLSYLERVDVCYLFGLLLVFGRKWF